MQGVRSCPIIIIIIIIIMLGLTSVDSSDFFGGPSTGDAPDGDDSQGPGGQTLSQVASFRGQGMLAGGPRLFRSARAALWVVGRSSPLVLVGQDGDERGAVREGRLLRAARL